MTGKEIAALLRRLDAEPKLVHSFEFHIARNKARETIIPMIPSGKRHNLSPDEMRFVLTHWRMTR